MNRRLAISAAALLLCVVAGAQKIDRGFGESSVFAARGSFSAGGSASFSSHDNNGYDIAVISGISSAGYSLGVAPQACYYFRDNMGVGIKGSYSRRYLDLAEAGVAMGDFSLNVLGYSLYSHDWSGAIYWRNFIPIGKSGRVAMFADLGIAGGQGQTKDIDAHSGHEVGTFTERTRAALYVEPGLAVKLGRHFGVSVSLGMAGVGMTRSTQVHNQVGNGSNGSWDVYLAPNFLELGFGLHLYL